MSQYPIVKSRVFSENELKKTKVKMVKVPNTKASDSTDIYRNALSPTGLFNTVEAFESVYDLFNRGLKFAGPQSQGFGHRPVITNKDPKTGKPVWGPWEWQTKGQVSERRFDFGSGLCKIRSEQCQTSITETQWTFGIYATNRPTWLISDHAGWAYSLVPVALFDTLGPASIEYIVNHSQLSVLICSIDKIQNVLMIAKNCPSLKIIISMDELNSEGAGPSSQHHSASGMGANAGAVLREWAAEKGVLLVSFKEVEEIGKKNRLAPVPPKAEDLATICYTSGTTGNPKGVILTHGNFLASTAGAMAVGVNTNPNDLHISYLPLAHVYERATLMGMIYNGTPVAFYRGDVSLLFEDIGDIKPTIFISVPRLYNRIHSAILQKTLYSGSSVTAALFSKALSSKCQSIKQSGVLTHALWDRLIFNKIRMVLGGRVRLMISGSAPISAEVLDTLRACFSCEVLEGFGQTETACVGSVNFIGDYNAGGTIGPVLPCSEVKLVDIPDMKYLSTDKPFPRGEIMIRGPNVMKGYYKEQKKTEETLSEDGWLSTGDVGLINNRGLLKIIDRKKHIFKLSQGEYVAPEKLENIFQASGYIAQIFIHGDSMENELVAIIVPEPEFCVKKGIEKGFLPPKTANPGPIQPGHPLPAVLKLLAKDPKFKKILEKDLHELGKAAKLAGFEFPKALFIEGDELMSIDNGLLTPTMKLKRDCARDKYCGEIKAMYKEIKAGRSSTRDGDQIASKL